MKGYFVTGPDTNVGKTVFAGELLQQLGTQGYKTLGLKPVSSGCMESTMGLLNKDALHLQKRSSVKLPYAWINPFAFKEGIPPDIAARLSGINLSVSTIMAACKPALSSRADWMVIEGAGGWQMPLNPRETIADLAKAFGFPVILVVKLRLGCINQAILTYQNILKTKMAIFGWVANTCAELHRALIEYNDNNESGVSNIIFENIKTIQQFLPIPFLGIIPYDKEKYRIDSPIETIDKNLLNMGSR